MQRTASNMRQRQHLKHASIEDLLQHVLTYQCAQGVKNSLGPWGHLFTFRARQVPKILPTDRIHRTEHHNFAVFSTFHHGLKSRTERQCRLTSTRPPSERDDADAGVQQQIKRYPLLSRATV